MHKPPASPSLSLEVCDPQPRAHKPVQRQPHPRLLGQVRVHLLLAERSHVMDLLVVALHDLPVLGDLLGVQELVGGRILGTEEGQG